jgi:hypothetical protein
MLVAHRPEWAAYETGEYRQKYGAGLSQKSSRVEARSMVRVHGKRRSVGSQGGFQRDARQVFDDLLATRARSRENGRDRQRKQACLGRFKDV